MNGFNLRLLFALAPGLALGTIAVAMADNVASPSIRFALIVVAIGSVAGMSWRVGAAALGGTITRAHGLPDRLKMVAGDSKRTTFDRETGLHTEWYFRLRVDEEIARAKRYGQPFTLLTLTADERQILDAARVTMKQWLREVDFAGDLGDTVALCLPNTPRPLAEGVISRLTSVVHGLQVTASEYPSDGPTVSKLLREEEWRMPRVARDLAA
jgi:hypothetical protein